MHIMPASPSVSPPQYIDAFSRIETVMASLKDEINPDALSAGIEEITYLLASVDAANLVADPRQHARLRTLRSRWADTWSALNGRLEYVFARENTHMSLASLMDVCRTHWLFREANDLLPAEIALLGQHIPNLQQSHVCHIGCGPLPYTALYFREHVGTLTLLDVWPEACMLCSGLCHNNGIACNVVQGWAQHHDYSAYDIVILSSMLQDKTQILSQIVRTAPKHLLCRSTTITRTGGVLESPLTDEDLALIPGTFLGQTNPPPQVADISFLFRLRA